jgi:hypothetical protein
MIERGGFFWFDPFGDAPHDAEVSGSAGGPISWGGAPSWPFEYRERPFGLIPLLPWRRRSRYEPHFQFFTDRSPDAATSDAPQMTISRKYVVAAVGFEPTTSSV